jgi:hypothetical protein
MKERVAYSETVGTVHRRSVVIDGRKPEFLEKSEDEIRAMVTGEVVRRDIETLCEALRVMIDWLDKNESKPSTVSLRDCVKHIATGQRTPTP